MEENESTGVIYQIKNKTTNKIYIGKAFSYVKNGKQKIRKHGGTDRFYKHLKAAINGSNDSPLLYEEMRKYKKDDDWEVSTLKVCLKTDLKSEETKFIEEKKSYLPENGYNFFIGDNKPSSGSNKKIYEKKKADANVNRAKDSKLKSKDDSKLLPANIYPLKSGNGYYVQIKINGKLYRQDFSSKDETMEEKLIDAKDYLQKIKQNSQPNLGAPSDSKTS